MSRIIFFDTESSDMPKWKDPSENPDQPHLVQIAAILADEDTREVVSTLDLLVNQEDWHMDDKASDIHKIARSKTHTFGVDESLVLFAFLAMWNQCKRVCHNRTFDQRMIRIACKRYAEEQASDAWADKENFFCTMLNAKKYGSPEKNLKDAYLHFTGKELQNHHNAMADARACMEIYWAMMDLNEG